VRSAVHGCISHLRVQAKEKRSVGAFTGNVYEWVLDWLGELYYSATPMGGWSNPLGPTSSDDNYKVVKGGAYALGDSSPNILRACKRGRTGINSRENYYGFRCAEELDLF